MAQELDYSRVERMRLIKDEDTPPASVKTGSSHNRPKFSTFILMLLTAIVFDIISVIPAIGSAGDVLGLAIFIPWFHFAGMKFTDKRIGLMGLTGILEITPVVQMIPSFTLNVILSYWMNGK